MKKQEFPGSVYITDSTDTSSNQEHKPLGEYALLEHVWTLGKNKLGLTLHNDTLAELHDLKVRTMLPNAVVEPLPKIIPPKSTHVILMSITGLDVAAALPNLPKRILTEITYELVWTAGG